MGGNYRFCYSANGTFGLLQADITPGSQVGRQRLKYVCVYIYIYDVHISTLGPKADIVHVV